MSLGSSLNAGVSGLQAQSAKMGAIADNIANNQTVGYKRADVQFSALVGAGAGNTGYVAGGAMSHKRMEISQQGLIQGTTVETDLAIDGDGFFIVRDGAGADASFAYTRAGSFRPDASGNFINAAGYYLQGWLLDDNGNFNNSGSLSSVQIVGLDAIQGLAEPTTRMSFRANLSAAETPVAAYSVGDMASGQITPHFSRSMEVFDAQGTVHMVTMGYTKTGPNNWAVEVYAVPASDVTQADGLLTSGNLVFNGDGTLNMAASSPALFEDFSPDWTTGGSSVPMHVFFGADDASGLTQYGDQYNVASNSANGGVRGQVASLEVDSTGMVSAIFEDGTMRKVFQLPIATFVNPDGLRPISGSAYQNSSASGAPVINIAGSGGTGQVVSSSLEGSTSDIAAEMASMIITQRAYSANTRVISTVDEMLAEVGNLKR